MICTCKRYVITEKVYWKKVISIILFTRKEDWIFFYLIFSIPDILTVHFCKKKFFNNVKQPFSSFQYTKAISVHEVPLEYTNTCHFVRTCHARHFTCLLRLNFLITGSLHGGYSGKCTCRHWKKSSRHFIVYLINYWTSLTKITSWD